MPFPKLAILSLTLMLAAGTAAFAASPTAEGQARFDRMNAERRQHDLLENSSGASIREGWAKLKVVKGEPVAIFDPGINASDTVGPIDRESYYTYASGYGLGEPLWLRIATLDDGTIKIEGASPEHP